METSLNGKALDFGSSDYGFESHVSKLPYNYFCSYLLNHLRLNSSKKSLSFEIVYTKKIYSLLKLLSKIGIVRNFFFIKKKKNIFIKIFIYFFKNSPLCKHLKLISTPSRSFFISLKGLKLLSLRTGGSVYVLSTSLGLLTHIDAIKNKIGGKFLMFITV